LLLVDAVIAIAFNIATVAAVVCCCFCWPFNVLNGKAWGLAS